MKRPIILLCAGVVTMAIAFAGCKQSLVISKVDYSQPIETVLVPNDNGMVKDIQHGLAFSVMPLQYAEMQDTSSVRTNQVRMIRGQEGYYYLTSSGFKNVYVLAPEKGKLKLVKKIKISEEGIDQPAFNQREPYVQLLNRTTGKTYALTAKGIKQPKSEKSK